MSGLMCSQCGMPYTENEAPTDEKIKGKFSGKTETNNEYKQGEDTFIDKNTRRTIRARKK